jgi:hypothetical protein
VALQSRTPKYGLGRHYPESAAGHCRLTLLQTAVKNGGITNRTIADAIGIKAFDEPTNVLKFINYMRKKKELLNDVSGVEKELAISTQYGCIL